MQVLAAAVVWSGFVGCAASARPSVDCADDDAAMQTESAGEGPAGAGFTCADILALGACGQVEGLGICGCSCPVAAVFQESSGMQMDRVRQLGESSSRESSAWAVKFAVAGCGSDKPAGANCRDAIGSEITSCDWQPTSYYVQTGVGNHTSTHNTYVDRVSNGGPGCVCDANDVCVVAGMNEGPIAPVEEELTRVGIRWPGYGDFTEGCHSSCATCDQLASAKSCTSCHDGTPVQQQDGLDQPRSCSSSAGYNATDPGSQSQSSSNNGGSLYFAIALVALLLYAKSTGMMTDMAGDHPLFSLNPKYADHSLFTQDERKSVLVATVINGMWSTLLATVLLTWAGYAQGFPEPACGFLPGWPSLPKDLPVWELPFASAQQIRDAGLTRLMIVIIGAIVQQITENLLGFNWMIHVYAQDGWSFAKEQKRADMIRKAWTMSGLLFVFLVYTKQLVVADSAVLYGNPAPTVCMSFADGCELLTCEKHMNSLANWRFYDIGSDCTDHTECGDSTYCRISGGTKLCAPCDNCAAQTSVGGTCPDKCESALSSAAFEIDCGADAYAPLYACGVRTRTPPSPGVRSGFPDDSMSNVDTNGLCKYYPAAIGSGECTSSNGPSYYSSALVLPLLSVCLVDWFVKTPLFYILSRVVGLTEKPTKPLLTLAPEHKDARTMIVDKYIHKGVGKEYCHHHSDHPWIEGSLAFGTLGASSLLKRMCYGQTRAAWSWLKILHDSEDTKGSWLKQEWEGLDFVPAVEVKLQLRNRRPETLKNLVLRFRVARASKVKNMVPPLFVPIHDHDHVLEGEYLLKDFEVPPGKNVDLVTISFVPGREFSEDLISESTDPRRNDGYQFFNLRVEIDDADGQLNEECITANTFPEFMMCVPDTKYFNPMNTLDSTKETLNPPDDAKSYTVVKDTATVYSESALKSKEIGTLTYGAPVVAWQEKVVDGIRRIQIEADPESWISIATDKKGKKVIVKETEKLTKKEKQKMEKQNSFRGTLGRKKKKVALAGEKLDMPQHTEYVKVKIHYPDTKEEKEKLDEENPAADTAQSPRDVMLGVYPLAKPETKVDFAGEVGLKFSNPLDLADADPDVDIELQETDNPPSQAALETE